VAASTWGEEEQEGQLQKNQQMQQEGGHVAACGQSPPSQGRQLAMSKVR
jgi:hypothetical protein